MMNNERMKGVSKEDRNPIIMDIHYKTKYIDIKTKVRAKLVMVKNYGCLTPKCANENISCSLQRLNRKCIQNGKKICLACKNELSQIDKKLVKVYTTNAHRNFQDIEGFLMSKTYFNFKRNSYGQIACFKDTIEQINEYLKMSKDLIETPTKSKMKILISNCKTTPLTWEVLEKKWERVRELRVAEAI